jgi:hypothetical protein
MAISMLEAPELDFWLSVVFIATSPCLASWNATCYIAE